MKLKYHDFLKSKVAVAVQSGFEIARDLINPMLFEHQKDAVVWAIEGGCRAIFAAFGLGKTFIQLEIGRMVIQREGGKGLIICPLGVKQEFSTDAKKLGIIIEYVRNDDEVKNSKADLLITNYERVRDGNINPDLFTFVSLDEASILRGYGTKTYQEFLVKFSNVKYKYVCTATPSPNRYKELIHYAGFLGIMDTGQALTRFFKRDSTKANSLTLYEHKEKEFWLWMSSWALFLTKPSDLGYSDEGYDLPNLNIHYHMVNVDHNSFRDEDKRGNVKLFRDAAMSLQDAAKEKRLTLDDRINKMLEIINKEPDKHFIIWHDLEAERHAIKKALPEAKDVYGSQDLDIREQRVIDFAEGRIKYLATKPKISGSGCNFQRHCADAIFLGIGYKFNDFIQAVHRIYRFLQDKEVNIHIIYAESEMEILRTLQDKWIRHDAMVEKMTDIVKKYGLANEAVKKSLTRSLGCERVEKKGEFYTAVNNDTVEECSNMPDNSIDFVVTSVPFSNHYEYSASYNDFGHNTNDDKFFEQMDYLIPELLRILKPGRVAAIHVKDRIMFGNVTGYGMPSLNPFSDDTSKAFRKHGFILFARITIVTDVVRENNQTYRLGWSEQCKDGTKMGVGCPEYILLFRKLPTDTSKAYADCPVKKNKEEYTRARWQIDAHGFWKSSGDRFITKEEIYNLPIKTVNSIFREYDNKHIYNYERHVEIAEAMEESGKLPATFMAVNPQTEAPYVWDDVNRMNTLNAKQSQKKLQQHICPLQLDIVERLITRFSNPGELVLDPFGGLMTVPYMAMKLNRRGYGIELNTDYFNDGCTYLEILEQNKTAPTLFDFINQEMAE